MGGLLSGTGYILLGVLRNENARYAVCFLAITVSFFEDPIIARRLI
jgi:hypothetical protein